MAGPTEAYPLWCAAVISQLGTWRVNTFLTLQTVSFFLTPALVFLMPLGEAAKSSLLTAKPFSYIPYHANCFFFPRWFAFFASFFPLCLFHWSPRWTGHLSRLAPLSFDTRLNFPSCLSESPLGSNPQALFLGTPLEFTMLSDPGLGLPLCLMGHMLPSPWVLNPELLSLNFFHRTFPSLFLHFHLPFFFLWLRCVGSLVRVTLPIICLCLTCPCHVGQKLICLLWFEVLSLLTLAGSPEFDRIENRKKMEYQEYITHLPNTSLTALDTLTQKTVAFNALYPDTLPLQDTTLQHHPPLFSAMSRSMVTYKQVQ